MNSNFSATPDELLAKIGDIIGVSELAFKARDAQLNAPVLVTENALVFLAWQDEPVF